MPRWGVWDKKEHIWYGDDNGPQLFPEVVELPNGQTMPGELAAQIFATSIFVRSHMRTNPEARIYEEEPVRMRDKITFDEPYQMNDRQFWYKLEGEA